MQTAYVCGFLFAEALGAPRVLLIRKARPSWQAGKLNGIGGHIEAGETPLQAMNREFFEEASIGFIPWEPVAVLTGDEFVVHFFSAWAAAETFDAAEARTDEPLVRVHMDSFNRAPVVPNLRVLIPLALDNTGIVKPVMLTDARPVAA